MDFFAMKRKKLQSYCKKHGIPANLKNIEMAKQLSLIYQGKENQNPAPPKLQADGGADKDKLNVEVIDLDSDSGADDVQMEALDTVAGNDSKDLRDEHKLEEEPDQLSEVKSDHNVDSGSAVGNADACEVNSASLQKTSHGIEESKLNSPSEGDDIGSVNVQESMQVSVNKEKNEDNQELHFASSSEDANMVDVEHEMLREQTDVDEDTSETENVGDEAEKLDEEPDQILTTPLSEVKSDHKVDSDTATKNAATRGVNFESSQKMSITTTSEKLIGSSTKLLSNSPTPRDIAICDVEENLQIGVNQEQDDHDQEKTMDFSPTMLSSPGTSASDSEESLQIHANKENIDPGEGWNPDPSAVDMNDDEDLTQSASEELGNDLIEGPVANGDNEIDHQDICGSGNGCDEDVNNCGTNSPHVSPKESSGCLVEQLHKLDDNNCVLSEDATVCLNASTGVKNIDEDTNLTVEEILDAVHSSSFENSSVQFPPIDPLHEVETNDLAVQKMAATDTSGVKVVSEAPADDLMEEEVAEVDDKFALVEDVFETGNGTKEAINQGSIDSPHGSNVNNADLLHVSPVESSSPLVGGQVQKSDDNVMHNGDYDLGNCGFGIDILYSHEKSIAAEDTDAKTNVSMENLPYESHAPSVKLLEEFGKKLEEVEFDLLEDDCETACKDEALNSSSIKTPQGSIVNDFNLLHDSLGDFSSYFDDEFQKPDDKIMHCGSGKSESGVDAFCFPDESIVAKNIDGKNNESMQKFSYEGNSSSFQYSDGTQDLSMTTGELHSSSGLNTYPMAALDVCEEEMLRSSEKTCMVADPKECIGFSANDFEASTNKGFEAETCFDPNTLGDVVMETCNMNESMQIDTMEKVNSQGECMNFFENSNVHDGVGAEDEPSETASRKRKRGDANSDEDVKDELVSTVPQTNEMELSNFRLQQLFASDTASGDEDAYQKKLVSPSKATPMIHKENIKFDREDKVGSVMSRNKFAKRQPLQDLKQN